MHARARDLHSDGGEEHGFFYDTYCMYLLLTPIILPDSCRIAESTRFEVSRVRRVMRTARPADGCAAGTVEQGNSVNILAAGLSRSRRARQPATTWMDRAVATRGRSTMQQREGECVCVCVRCVCVHEERRLAPSGGGGGEWEAAWYPMLGTLYYILCVLPTGNTVQLIFINLAWNCRHGGLMFLFTI